MNSVKLIRDFLKIDYSGLNLRIVLEQNKCTKKRPLTEIGLATRLAAKRSEGVQVRIQDLVNGRVPSSEAESCRCSKVKLHERSEPLVAGGFWVFNVQICSLLHRSDSFPLILTTSSTPKIVNYIVFLYLHEKFCL